MANADIAINPSDIVDTDRLTRASSRFGSEYRIWDEGFGPLWVYRESLGVVGIVRARTWEEAYSCVEDEIMDDANLDAEEIAEVEASGELPEGCHYRGSGVPSNPQLKESIAREDLNGSSLDPLTDANAAEWGITVYVERD